LTVEGLYFQVDKCLLSDQWAVAVEAAIGRKPFALPVSQEDGEFTTDWRFFKDDLR
jgi:hypothetical protein